MLSLIIASVLSCSSPDIALLSKEAPETLLPPKQEQFVSYPYYARAEIMYKACNHWNINNQFNPFI